MQLQQTREMRSWASGASGQRYRCGDMTPRPPHLGHVLNSSMNGLLWVCCSCCSCCCCCCPGGPVTTTLLVLGLFVVVVLVVVVLVVVLVVVIPARLIIRTQLPVFMVICYMFLIQS